MVDFKTIMSEQKLVNRYFITGVYIFGAFCGALLAVAYMLIAVAPK